jgi:sigma-B regulation protein RsbQ
MRIQQRHNVCIGGRGPVMVFAHGFGCDQTMWRYITPAFNERYTTILFDLIGSGQSDLAAYDPDRYSSLHGHALDILEIVDALSDDPIIFVGHSVSASIGMLAAIERPDRFSANLMVGPSPSFITDGDYVGGFTREDVEELLDTLENNYLGWSSNMAPAIMGVGNPTELQQELTNSFCRTDPEIAKHFARVTFLADHRADLAKVTTRTLILQSDDDFLAPKCVGEYMHRMIRNSVLETVENIGHCPHLSAPSASIASMERFLGAHDL